jgi:alkylation response protein AidB-like acyl-CoA dehydrogenase
MSVATTEAPERVGTRVLARERATLERLLPGLDAQLAELPLAELEEPGGPGIGLFADAGGAGLLIPESSDGLGADPVEAIDVQRAIGSRAPSLAIATTMHHFSIGTLVELAAGEEGLETLLLQAVARDGSLVASGFAEGQTGQSILAPTMTAQRSDGGWTVSGTKKPCSLSASMKLLTASVSLEDEGEPDGSMGVALIPADGDGIERKPFWSSLVLRAAESDELVVDGVHVPDQLVFRLDTDGDGGLDRLTADGFVWFELLISASYLGMASAMLERAIEGGKGTAAARVDGAIELEGARAALEAVARELADGERSDDLLARSLLARYAVQEAIARATPQLAECLGGMSYIGSTDVGYLYAAARALAFHPPSRLRMADRLAAYLDGEELTVG